MPPYTQHYKNRIGHECRTPNERRGNLTRKGEQDFVGAYGLPINTSGELESRLHLATFATRQRGKPVVDCRLTNALLPAHGACPMNGN